MHGRFGEKGGLTILKLNRHRLVRALHEESRTESVSLSTGPVQAQGYTELSHEELRNWRGRGVPNELHLDSGLSVVTELSRW
jgi:hypothetical protein